MYSVFTMLFDGHKMEKKFGKESDARCYFTEIWNREKAKKRMHGIKLCHNGYPILIRMRLSEADEFMEWRRGTGFAPSR